MIIAALRAFVAEELKLDPDKLNETDRLQHDLGLDGADAQAFIDKFAERFDVDMTNFVFRDYFGRESFGCIPLWIVWIAIPPLRPKVRPVTLADLQRSARAKKWKRPKKSD
ncbi:MAG TPA: DUF1493 family protein [Thermoanaerobaculia bacterium]|nr:DUF1493 family protein [Thermoanaerobaculia bacterium]